jgi:hypothetical protein
MNNLILKLGLSGGEGKINIGLPKLLIKVCIYKNIIEILIKQTIFLSLLISHI